MTRHATTRHIALCHNVPRHNTPQVPPHKLKDLMGFASDIFMPRLEALCEASIQLDHGTASWSGLGMGAKVSGWVLFQAQYSKL